MEVHVRKTKHGQTEWRCMEVPCGQAQVDVLVRLSPVPHHCHPPCPLVTSSSWLFPEWPHFLPRGWGRGLSARSIALCASDWWDRDADPWRPSVNCVHVCACACMSDCLWSPCSFLLLVRAATVNSNSHLCWVVILCSKLTPSHQHSTHFLFQIMNEHSEHQRFQCSSLDDFTDNLSQKLFKICLCLLWNLCEDQPGRFFWSSALH